MSQSQTSQYIVKVDGPVNIKGALKRKGDPVDLTLLEFDAYFSVVKKAPRVAKPAKEKND